MNRSQAKLPVDVDVIDVVVYVDSLGGVAWPRWSWQLSPELVEAFTAQTAVKTADVTRTLSHQAPAGNVVFYR